MKKTISILLSIVMILAMMPVCTGIAFAEEGLPLIAPNPIPIEEVYLGEFYSVYLYSDGELLTMTSALDGTQVTPPATNPQKDDYKFAGWYADETLKTEFDFSQPIIGTTNIYAKWKKLSSKSIKSGLEKTSITAKSKLAKSSSGKDGIKITWEKAKGCKVDYYQIQRATSKDGKYETIYTTKSGNATSYVNTKNLKNGKKYYYRVRGVRTVNGKKVYTKWGKCYRTFKVDQKADYLGDDPRGAIIDQLLQVVRSNSAITGAGEVSRNSNAGIYVHMYSPDERVFGVVIPADCSIMKCRLYADRLSGKTIDTVTFAISDFSAVSQWIVDHI